MKLQYACLLAILCVTMPFKSKTKEDLYTYLNRQRSKMNKEKEGPRKGEYTADSIWHTEFDFPEKEYIDPILEKIKTLLQRKDFSTTSPLKASDIPNLTLYVNLLVKGLGGGDQQTLRDTTLFLDAYLDAKNKKFKNFTKNQAFVTELMKLKSIYTKLRRHIKFLNKRDQLFFYLSWPINKIVGTFGFDKNASWDGLAVNDIIEKLQNRENK